MWRAVLSPDGAHNAKEYNGRQVSQTLNLNNEVRPPPRAVDLSLAIIAHDKLTRSCLCGCNLQFTVSSTSRKIYYNRTHKVIAKDFRRKLKGAIA